MGDKNCSICISGVYIRILPEYTAYVHSVLQEFPENETTILFVL